MKNYLNKSFKMIIVALLATITFNVNAQKKSIEIETIKIIDAPKPEVYKALKSLELFPKWSPFLVTDPNQKYEITGIDGEIGSKYSWEGVDEKTEGYQSLTQMKPNDYIKMSCEMYKPFKGKPIFEYELVEEDGKTKVIQNFSLKISGFNKFMVKMFGIKKKMIATNDLGMVRFKDLMESKDFLVSKK